MSVARCREINARLRAAGITVHEYPGCWTRGNGQSPAYEGGIVHHTASAFGMALPGIGIGRLLAEGRHDLPGPLCNWSDNVDGSCTFFAAFPANHAGASGGRSMGPLPVTSLFNKRVLGLEIVYPGTVPMRTAQYRTALIWSRIATDVVGGGDIQRARAHAETSITGKWDPGDAPGRTINMAAFRTAARIISQEDDMFEAADRQVQATMAKRVADMAERVLAVCEETDTAAGRPVPYSTHFKGLAGRVDALLHNRPTVTWGPTTGEPNRLALSLAALQTQMAALATHPDITPEQLAAEVDKAIARHKVSAEDIAAAIDVIQRPYIEAAVRAVLGEDNTDQADQIVDEIVSRLTNPNL